MPFVRSSAIRSHWVMLMPCCECPGKLKCAVAVHEAVNNALEYMVWKATDIPDGFPKNYLKTNWFIRTREWLFHNCWFFSVFCLNFFETLYIYRFLWNFIKVKKIYFIVLNIIYLSNFAFPSKLLLGFCSVSYYILIL